TGVQTCALPICRHILPQLVTNSRDSLLNASHMPISQLRLRHIQDPPEDRQVRSNQDATMMKDSPPSDAPRSTRDFLPFDHNIVDWLKLSVYADTSQSFDGAFREFLEY